MREQLGIEPELLERAKAGEQETVDHLIQLRMHRHVPKYRADPGTIIPATGHGKGYCQEDGFLYDVEGFIEDGWRIELLSWEHSCHRKLRAFAKKYGKFISLDDHYHQITFIKDGRIVNPLERCQRIESPGGSYPPAPTAPRAPVRTGRFHLSEKDP